MQVIYTGEEMPDVMVKSIFLAGPSLRPGQEKEMESWRKDALKILEDKGFTGTIFCPENKGFGFKDKDFNYDDQVEWEDKYLNLADCILFWIPRDLSLNEDGQIKLPAFTTNVEWGSWCDSGKVVFGAPKDAEKNTYLKHYAEKYNVPIGDTLTETLDNAIEMLGDGAEREGGARYVPLFIWQTDSFQSWYKAQTEAGNKLDKAELLYSFRPRFKNFVFLWILKVSVYIASEDRYKTNEFVLARTDISSVLLWSKGEDLQSSKIILIREFRSPANTEDGFIYELAGGSSPKKGTDPKDTAAEEILEETGFSINPKDLKFEQARQLLGTLSSHKSYLYSYQLEDDELEWFESQKGIVHGKEEDSERTFVEVKDVKTIIENNLLDWSSIGMVLSVLSFKFSTL